MPRPRCAKPIIKKLGAELSTPQTAPDLHFYVDGDLIRVDEPPKNASHDTFFTHEMLKYDTFVAKALTLKPKPPADPRARRRRARTGTIGSWGLGSKSTGSLVAYRRTKTRGVTQRSTKTCVALDPQTEKTRKNTSRILRNTSHQYACHLSCSRTNN